MTTVFSTPITPTSLTDGTLTPSAIEGTISVIEISASEYALKCNIPAGATYQAKAQASHSIAPSKLTDAYFAAKIRFTLPPQIFSLEDHRVILLSILGAAGLRIFANKNGTFQWHLMCVNRHTDGSVVVEEFSFPISPSLFDGANHFLVIHWLRSSTAGIVEAWIDGTLIGRVTGLNTADVTGFEPAYNGGVTTFIAGLVTPNGLFGAPEIEAYVDDLAIADAYIAPPPIVSCTLIMAHPVNGAYDTASPYLGEGAYTLPVGATAEFRAIPNVGYQFVKWQLETDYAPTDGVWDAISDLSTSNPSYFNSGTANAAFRVTPIFAPVPTYTLTYSSIPVPTEATIGGIPVNSGGSVTASSGTALQVVISSEVEVSMITYRFVKFIVNGVDYSGTPSGSNTTISVLMDSDKTVVAVREAVIEYNLFLAASVGGSISPTAGTYTQNQGTTLSVTAIPNSGYKVEGWYLDGLKVSVASSYIFQFDANHVLYAQFTPITYYNLTITSTLGGSTNPSGTITKEAYLTQVVVATPDLNYEFTDWLLDGVVVSTALSYTVLFDGDHLLTAEFSYVEPPPTPHYITIQTPENGVVTPNPGVYEGYATGQPLVVVATPVTDYKFSKWLLDAEEHTENPIVVAFNANHILQAVFVEGDRKILDLKGYSVWFSTLTTLYYILDSAGALKVESLPTLQDAIDWINANTQGISTGIIVAGIGLAALVYLSGKK